MARRTARPRRDSQRASVACSIKHTGQRVGPDTCTAGIPARPLRLRDGVKTEAEGNSGHDSPCWQLPYPGMQAVTMISTKAPEAIKLASTVARAGLAAGK
jgi:hypothetical protein